MGTEGDLDQLSDEHFDQFRALTHELTGISIHQNRKSMLCGRLRKRILQIGLKGYSDYLKQVRTSEAEKKTFVDLITTNETNFFRTPRVWGYLEKFFLPFWMKKNPGGFLKVWSAAASTGEEAVSMAIICQEFKEKNPGFQFQILGTDISGEMIGHCQLGIYDGKTVDSFKKERPEIFAKYMRSESTGFIAVPEIRSRLKFQTHNLFQALPVGHSFDLILLRNVLIYFTQQDQEKVLSRAHSYLSQDGILIIGESESLTHVKSDFCSVEPLVYEKRRDVELKKVV